MRDNLIFVIFCQVYNLFDEKEQFAIIILKINY